MVIGASYNRINPTSGSSWILAHDSPFNHICQFGSLQTQNHIQTKMVQWFQVLMIIPLLVAWPLYNYCERLMGCPGCGS